jgi:hypothetical protein
MDEVGQPFWVFRLTSGVGARLIPLGVLLFVVANLACIALAGWP